METFILAADDPGLIERFGAEVAPAVREAVAAERLRCRAVLGVGPVTGSDGERRPNRSCSISAAPESRPSTNGSASRRPPTPAFGCRPSAPWDETTRPHRPESAPDVRYTDQGKQVGAHLIEVHDMLRAELTQVRDLIEQVRHGQLGIGSARSAINQMTMRQNNWTLGRVLRELLPGGHPAPLEGGPGGLPVPGSRETALAPVIDRLADGARGDPRRAGRGRSRTGRAGRRPGGARRRAGARWICSPTPCSRTCPTKSRSWWNRWRGTGSTPVRSETPGQLHALSGWVNSVSSAPCAAPDPAIPPPAPRSTKPQRTAAAAPAMGPARYTQ